MTRLSRNGPRLEVFKFSLYLFFPIFIFAHYGDPDWYDNHVKHLVSRFTRPDLKERASMKPLPQNTEELKVALEEAKQERLKLRERRRAQLEQEGERAV
ncbi:hypothetical protein BT69DRAFT_1345430 [Atractiella rhizophila]|nr:hypothetical protein BT69DRAFT_1345430 [Atractiella rhizophila]